jgi:glyoxylase-like metal-dependent hydrolase (beta-lactamase superfamily II)
VTEIVPDVWMLEGFAGKNFFLEPPSCNIFVLRDRDMVLLMDTGHHPFYRETMLEVLRRYSAEGVRQLILTLSHGHWDHGKNNDVIYEAGFEAARFLLPEPEMRTINVPAHMAWAMDEAMRYFDPFKMMAEGFKLLGGWARGFPAYEDPRYRKAWETISSLPDEYDRSRTRDAYRLLLTKILMPDLSTYIADRAELLRLESREERRFGEVVVQGWPMGRFFAIHDASQSPGHISIYDPQNRLMITGDTTLEINPPFFDCDFGNCIAMARKCRIMAEQGDITVATDCHRTSQFWPENLQAWGLQSLDPLQLIDVARGRDECVAFYQLWEDYFTQLRDETLAAHTRLGEATIEEIVAELGNSSNKNVVFKLSLDMPQMPSSPEMMVTRVLVENGASRREDGDRILFTP